MEALESVVAEVLEYSRVRPSRALHDPRDDGVEFVGGFGSHGADLGRFLGVGDEFIDRGVVAIGSLFDGFELLEMLGQLRDFDQLAALALDFFKLRQRLFDEGRVAKGLRFERRNPDGVAEFDDVVAENGFLVALFELLFRKPGRYFRSEGLVLGVDELVEFLGKGGAGRVKFLADGGEFGEVVFGRLNAGSVGPEIFTGGLDAVAERGEFGMGGHQFLGFGEAGRDFGQVFGGDVELRGVAGQGVGAHRHLSVGGRVAEVGRDPGLRGDGAGQGNSRRWRQCASCRSRRGRARCR